MVGTIFSYGLKRFPGVGLSQNKLCVHGNEE